jgi:hypothetical protein
MTAETKQGKSSLAAFAFAAFAVVGVAAFLWFRGSDIGQLPKLVGNLGGGPLFGGEIANTAIGSLIAILIGHSWFGLGSFVLKFVEIDDLGRMRGTLATALGLLLYGVALFFLGLAGLYSSVVAVALLMLGVALALYAHSKLPSVIDEAKSDNFSTAELAIIGAILLTVGLAAIASPAPPVAKDTLLYHFALPNAFVTQHSNAIVQGNIASYLALGAEMQYVWAMLLGNIVNPRVAEVSAGFIGPLLLMQLVRAIYRWAIQLEISRTPSLITAFVVAAIPTAYHVASSGYIDLSLALYVTLATYALTRWWKESTWGWTILVAIFLGAAFSIKLTAVFVFAAFALIILLRARAAKDPVATAPGSEGASVVPGPGRVAVMGFAALLLAGVIASPWYIRTWVATGSPVFPFYMSIWPGKAEGWDVERSNLFQAMNSQYGGADVNKLNYLTAPVRVSVMAQPEQPANYDGVLGPALLIGLPLLIFALWKLDLAVEIKIMVGVAGIMYLFWLFSSEQLRYLLPVAPMLAIAIVASAEKIGGRVAQVAKYALIAASVCGLLTTLAWFAQKAPLRVVLGGETRDEYLTRNLDYYSYYRWINTETAPDARVWLINMRRDTYHIERAVFSDYLFEDWTLRKLLWETRSVEELRARAAAMKIQYVLTRHDFLFDYDRSTLVDDKKPRAENEAKLRIAREFILDPANTIKADGKFSLIKVFTER